MAKEKEEQAFREANSMGEERCEDCIYYKKFWKGFRGKMCLNENSPNYHNYTNEDDFCYFFYTNRGSSLGTTAKDLRELEEETEIEKLKQQAEAEEIERENYEAEIEAEEDRKRWEEYNIQQRYEETKHAKEEE